MDRKLVLCLLGSPEIELDNVPVTGFMSQKVQAILFYLAMVGQTQSRVKLAALFWPDEPESKARKNVRDVAQNLRKLLPDHVEVTRSTMGMASEAVCEVDAFALETAVTQSPIEPEQLAQATTAYRGDFLDGFAIKSAPEFDTWVVSQTVRLRELQLQGLRWLSEYALNRRDIQAGMRLTRQSLMLEPWQEHVYKQRMLLYAYGQQPEMALQTYTECKQMLFDAFGTKPRMETEALYQRLLAETGKLETGTPHHNLPRQLTTFFGRADDAHIVREKVLDDRYPLLTITGEGGIGKTRLALTIAEQSLYDFKDGVWFVPLAGIRVGLNQAEAEDAVATAVANALDLNLSATQPVKTQVLDYLKPLSLLLFFDNFEHVLEARGFIYTLLQEAKRVQLLITSRARMRFQSEFVYRLSGLPIPTEETPVAEMPDFAGIALFMERANRAKPFNFSNDNAPCIQKICALVDGLPLGIELAAALVEEHSCLEISERIQPDKLETPFFDVPDRHRSIQALFEYSWQLLSEAAQTVLAQCCQFAGGFTLEAAQVVAGARPRILEQLVYQSLLREEENASTEHGRTVRYDIHPLIQQFCQDKFETLCQTNLHLQDVSMQHTAYFFDWLRTHVASSGETPLALLKMELNNIRQAWHTAIQAGQFAELDACVDAYYSYISTISLFKEGKDAYTEALDALDNAMQSHATQELREIKGHLLFARYHLDSRLGRYDKRMQTLDEVLTLIQDPVLMGRVHITRTYVLIFQGKLQEAKVAARHAETLLVDEPKWRIQVFNHLAWIFATEGDAEQATYYYEKAVAGAHEIGNLFLEQAYLHNFAQFWQQQCHYEKALSYYQQALALSEMLHLPSARIETLISLSFAYNHIGYYDDAFQVLAEAQELADQTKDLRVEMSVWHELGLTHYLKGEFEAALQMAQKAVTAHDQLDATYELMMSCMLLGDIGLALGKLPEAEQAYQRAVCVRQENGDEVSLAEPWAGLAIVALQNGDELQAQAWVDQILALAGDALFYHKLIGFPLTIYLRCYWVLTAVSDPRASSVLQTVQTQLRQQADRITDADMRECFLGVPMNQQILQSVCSSPEKADI